MLKGKTDLCKSEVHNTIICNPEPLLLKSGGPSNLGEYKADKHADEIEELINYAKSINPEIVILGVMAENNVLATIHLTGYIVPALDFSMNKNSYSLGICYESSFFTTHSTNIVISDPDIWLPNTLSLCSPLSAWNNWRLKLA